MNNIFIILFIMCVGLAVYFGGIRDRSSQNYIVESEEILTIDIVSESGIRFFDENKEKITSLYRDQLCKEEDGVLAVQQLLSSENEIGAHYIENREAMRYYFLLACSDGVFSELLRVGEIEFGGHLMGIDPYFAIYFSKSERLRLIPPKVHREINLAHKIGLLEFSIIYRCTKDRVEALVQNGVKGNRDFLARKKTNIKKIAMQHCPKAIDWIDGVSSNNGE